MYREEQFLKYLDNELPPGGIAEVEKILASDPEARQQMESLKADRESLLTVLDGLNPIDDVNIPAFRRPGPFGIRRQSILRYAAAAVLILGVGLTFWLLNKHTDANRDENTLSVMEIELQEEALDCYISPNRCWNERKLPLIIIEIK